MKASVYIYMGQYFMKAYYRPTLIHTAGFSRQRTDVAKKKCFFNGDKCIQMSLNGICKLDKTLSNYCLKQLPPEGLNCVKQCMNQLVFLTSAENSKEVEQSIDS